MSDEEKVLRERLERAESVLAALQDHEVDAVLGKRGVALVRLREAEDALRRTEERLHLALDAAELAFWEIDPADESVTASPRLREMFGLSPSGDVQFRDQWRDAVVPEDREAVRKAVDRAISSGEKYDVQFRIRRPDGEVRWIQSIGRCVADEPDGAPTLIGICADVTERRWREDALRESEDRLRVAMEAARVGMWSVDIPSDRWEFSPEAATVFGLPAGVPATVDRITALTHPDDAAALAEQSAAALGSPGVHELEYRIVRPDGEVRWVLLRGRTAAGPDGRPLRNMGVVLDITERKRSEQALHESEARLRALVDNLPFDFWAMDTSGRYTVANPACEEAWGARVGRTPEEVAPSPEILEQWRAHNERAFAGEVVSGEVTYERDAQARTFHSIVAPVTVQDEIRGILGVNIDVTDLKHAEEALLRERNLLQSVLDSAGKAQLAYLDRDFNFVRVNEPYASTCGYRPEEMIGLNHFALYPHAENEALFRRVRDSGEPLQVLDKPFEFPDQPERGVTYWDWTLIPVKDAAGRVTALILSLFETTKRKRAEEALRDLNITLEHRVAERTAEVRQQAAQLRALASRLSQAEQVERKRLAKVLHDHIQQLIVAAKMQLEWAVRDDNLERLRATAQGVYAILDEAQQAARSLTVELSPPVLHETGLIGGLNWLVSRMRERDQFAVRLRADSRAEPPAEETRFLLFECVRELLLNAVKHAGVREADVTLMRPGDGEIEVIVSDAGEGFDPDVVRKRRPDEVSFGLFSIQERLVHLGGRMDIESAPGRGTQVTLVVPVVEDEDAAAAPVEEAAADVAAVNIRRKPETCRVLVVDDHQIMREGLVRLFEFETDIEVVGQAADGPEAVALAGRLEPDVVLMDVNLGEMDGVEATRRILAARPDTRVVGLSMHVDDGVANAMRDAGAVAYLTKGGPSQDLIEAIRACHRG